MVTSRLVYSERKVLGMTLRPASRLNLRLLTLSLLLLCGWPLVNVHAQDVLNLTLNIKVMDESGKPIPNAKVKIPRKGRNAQGQTLGDINAETDERGVFSKGNIDFQLTGTPHKLIVTAQNLPQMDKELPDDLLREAFNNNQHHLDLQISPPRVQGVVSLTITGTVTDASNRPIPNAQISIPRQGKELDDQELDERTASADSSGKYSINAKFLLEGVPHKLVAQASGFDPVEKPLADDMLRAANNTIITLPLKLGAPAPTSSFFKTLPSLVSRAIWWIGLASSILLLLLLIVVIIPPLRRKIYPQRANIASSETMAQSPSVATVEQTTETKQDSLESRVKKIDANVYVLKENMVTKEMLWNAIDELKSAFSAFEVKLEKIGMDVKKASGNPDTDGSRVMALTSAEAAGSSSDRAYVGKQRTEEIDNWAMVAYQNLPNKNPVTPDPLYLDVEAPRSEAGRLEDKNIYLSQVNHSKGSLVLFTDGTDYGWLFPNPNIAFRPAATKDVFPEFKRPEDYEANKENLRPKRVRRIENGRWLVVQ
jgi:hypothetical protein